MSSLVGSIISYLSLLELIGNIKTWRWPWDSHAKHEYLLWDNISPLLWKKSNRNAFRTNMALSRESCRHLSFRDGTLLDKQHRHSVFIAFATFHLNII